MFTRIEIQEAIDKARSKGPWSLAAKIMYDLCKKHPSHKSDEEIVAKVWIIGRTYSAAIERRKAFLDISGYDFYPKCVVPRIRESDIDKWFSSLKNIRLADHNNMQTILEIHYHVTNLFADISGLEKRSLASKYLHFHFPKLYYVYDARVRAVVKRFMPVKNSVKHYDGYADNEYRKFYEKCLQIRDNIWEHHRVKLTPRQMDKLFLHLSNDKLRK